MAFLDQPDIERSVLQLIECLIGKRQPLGSSYAIENEPKNSGLQFILVSAEMNV
jgi:hypothetical protein